jgi:hypothetical protein
MPVKLTGIDGRSAGRFVELPISSAFFADPRTAMANSGLRFFAVEHVFVMVVAVGVAHLGRLVARKAATPVLRHRRAALWALALLLVTLVGVPWPFLAHGRPLLRGS